MASLEADRESIRVVRDTAPIALTRSLSDVRAAIGAKTSNRCNANKIGNGYALIEFTKT